jgi:hypothetical protein
MYFFKLNEVLRIYKLTDLLGLVCRNIYYRQLQIKSVIQQQI